MASSISGAARELVRIVIHAVDAAISGDDVVTYDRAIARLASEPAGGRVLGDVLRSLLEDTHPDRSSSDDITLVVGRSYRAAVAWLPPDRVDVTVLRWLARWASTRPASPTKRSTCRALTPTSTAIPTIGCRSDRRPGPSTRGMRRCWRPTCCRSLPQRWLATWRARSPSTRGRPAKN